MYVNTSVGAHNAHTQTHSIDSHTHAPNSHAVHASNNFICPIMKQKKSPSKVHNSFPMQKQKYAHTFLANGQYLPDIFIWCVDKCV